MPKKNLTIFERYQCKNPLNELFDGVQFNIVNPTDSLCAFDLFRNTETNTPNTPLGWVPQGNNPTVFSPSYYAPLPPGSTTIPDTECATVTSDTQLGICYVPTSDRIYAALFGSIRIINPNTNTTVATPATSLSGLPTQLAYCSGQDTVYATDQSNTISVIDCSSQTELTTITLPGNASHIAYCESNNYLYVTIPGLLGIYFYDCSTNTLVGNLAFIFALKGVLCWSNGGNNYGMAFAPAATTALLFDTDTNLVITSIALPSVLPASVQCYNSVKNSVYYVDATSNAKEIDIPSRTVLGTTIPLTNPTDFCYVSQFDSIYVPYGATNSVDIIDCQTNTVTKNATTSISGATAGAAAYNPLGNNTWITGNAANSKISKLCPSSPTVMCYITGSTDYSEWVQDIINCRKCIRQIMIVCDNVPQVNTPVQITYKDASGQQCFVYKIPNITLSSEQYQSQFQNAISAVNIATLDFFDCKELVVDGLSTWINNYPIQPNSTVKIVMWYKEICPSEEFTEKKSMCEQHNLNCNDANSRTEWELCFQSPRPRTRPKWLKDYGTSNPKIDNTDGLCDYDAVGHPIMKTSLSKKYITLQQLEAAVAHIPKNPVQKFMGLDSVNIDKLIGHPIVKKQQKLYVSEQEMQDKANQVPIKLDTGLDRFYPTALKTQNIFESDHEIAVAKVGGKKLNLTPKRVNRRKG